MQIQNVLKICEDFKDAAEKMLIVSSLYFHLSELIEASFLQHAHISKFR